MKYCQQEQTWPLKANRSLADSSFAGGLNLQYCEQC